MKNIILLSLLFIASVAYSPVLGQEHSNSDKHNYVVLTNKVEQLKPILLSAEALKKEDGRHFGEFKVIICGKNIADITEPHRMEQHLKKAAQLGVDLVACGFSLKKFNVDATRVPDQMSRVDNGILYNLQLQKAGYFSLSL